MAQINQGPQKKDPLDTLMKGLNVASQVYGIKANMAALDDHAKQVADQEKTKAESDATKKRLSEGKYNQAEQIALAKDYDISPNKPAAGSSYQIADAKTGTPLFLSYRKQIVNAPTKEIETIKDGVNGTAIVNTNTGEMTSFFPKKEKELADSKPSKVTSQTAQEIGGFDAALDMANQLEEKYNSLSSGAGSYIKSFIPGSDPNKYEKDRDYAAQAIGVILEKGKLTDKDYDRYREMMPSPSDKNVVAAEKMLALKNAILSKKRSEIGGLEQAGFATKGYPAQDEMAQTSIGNRSEGNSGEATAAPAGPTAIDLLKIKAANGDKKAQDYIKSLGQ